MSSTSALVCWRPGKADLDHFPILDEMWGVMYEGTTGTLDQHIAAGAMRSKLIPPIPGT
jgi:hypothetical protein